MTAALIGIFYRSFLMPPLAFTLDIDETCDAVHGRCHRHVGTVLDLVQHHGCC